MKVKRLSDVSKFTLIELLIAIAIIAILAALLLPALNSAKAKGQAIACGGNLRSCGIALQQYTGDNQDCMPYSPAIYDQASFRYKETWECKLGNYMGWSSKMGGPVFHCPSRADGSPVKLEQNLKPGKDWNKTVSEWTLSKERLAQNLFANVVIMSWASKTELKVSSISLQFNKLPAAPAAKTAPAAKPAQP